MAKKPAETSPLAFTAAEQQSHESAVDRPADAKPARKQPAFLQVAGQIDRKLSTLPVGTALRVLDLLLEEYRSRQPVRVPMCLPKNLEPTGVES